MNLYEILFTHYSQKDNMKGIATYIVAKEEEEVYEYLKTSPTTIQGVKLYTTYKDNEDDYGTSYKERIVAAGGCMYDEESDVYDLYYGFTQFGWELKKENITKDEIQVLDDLGLLSKL